MRERPTILVSPDILDPAVPVAVDEVPPPPPAAGGSPQAIHLDPETSPAIDTEPRSLEPGGVAMQRGVERLEDQPEPIAANPETARPVVEEIADRDTDIDAEPGLDATGLATGELVSDSEDGVALETAVATDVVLDEDAGSGLPHEAVTTTEVPCPNCGKTLASRPISQTHCLHCDRIIHVRARQTLFRSGLVGEDDVDAIDFLERIEPFGIEERQCVPLMSKQPLAAILWQLCEDRLAQISTLRQAHLLKEMAQYVRWQGKDATPLRKRAETASLLGLKEHGVERVKIVTRGEAACAVCREKAGVILDVACALDTHPLPVSECTGRDTCRCAYAEAE